MEQIDEREIKMQIKSLQIVPNFMDLKILGRCFYFECSAHVLPKVNLDFFIKANKVV